MKSGKTILRLLILFLTLAGIQETRAQQSTTLFWEPEFSLEIPTNGRWAFSVGAANRTQYFVKQQGQRIEGRNQEHIELNQFTSYRSGARTILSLGFRYRFTEAFNPGSYDEFRIVQQLNYANPGAFLGLAHRFRLEERFRNVVTILRSRYQISVSKPLGGGFEAGLGTEILYSLAGGMEPELDQRFSVGLSNSAIQGVEISIGFEYQYENYLNTPENELFLQSGISLEL